MAAAGAPTAGPSLTVRIGLGLPTSLPGAGGELILEAAMRADRGPFSSVGVIDRLAYDCFDPFVVLGAAAAVTRRVRLATTLLIGPLRNTVLLAKAAASLHALSGGRLVLGLGLGARAEDYRVAGVEPRGRSARLEEQLVQLPALWEAGRVGAWPTAGRPPILLGGVSDPVFARAARFADGYLHPGGPPRVFARAAEKARAAWIDAGRPGRPELWGQGYFALGPEAEEAGRRYLRHYYAFAGPVAERVAAGLLTTPEAVREFVAAYAAAGCDELLLIPTVADLAQLDRLAEVVG